jgi:hypothetical protein
MGVGVSHIEYKTVFRTKAPILGVFLLTVQIFRGETTHHVTLRQLGLLEVQVGSLMN